MFSSTASPSAEKAILAPPPNGPWVSFDLELDTDEDPILELCESSQDSPETWTKYPGGTKTKIESSGLADATVKTNKRGNQCSIRLLDIKKMGKSSKAVIQEENAGKVWSWIRKPVGNTTISRFSRIYIVDKSVLTTTSA